MQETTNPEDSSGHIAKLQILLKKTHRRRWYYGPDFIRDWVRMLGVSKNKIDSIDVVEKFSKKTLNPQKILILAINSKFYLWRWRDWILFWTQKMLENMSSIDPRSNLVGISFEQKKIFFIDFRIFSKASGRSLINYVVLYSGDLIH